MTREEKIDWLCRLRSDLDVWIPEMNKYKKMYKQVLSEAIEALSEPTKTDTDEQNEYCSECTHAEVCSWYGTIGCEFKEKNYKAVLEDIKAEIKGLVTEGENDYQLGFNGATMRCFQIIDKHIGKENYNESK